MPKKTIFGTIYGLSQGHGAFLRWFLALLLCPLFLLGAEKNGTIASNLALTPEESDFLKGRKIRVAVDSARPPFEFMDDKGQYSGICASFIQACAKKLGVEVVVVPGLAVAPAIEKAEAGEVDVIPKVTPTPEREKHVLFTAAYITFPSVIITRRDARFIGGIEDLDGLKVGVMKGLVVEELLKRDHPKLPLIPLSNVKEALLQVSTGKIDVFIDNLGTVSYNIDKLGLTNLKITAPTAYNHDLAFAVRKDMPLLRSALDKALASMTNQERTAIKEQWLAITYQQRIAWQTIAPFAWGLVAIILVVLVWNQRLRHVVQERGRVQQELREHAFQLESQAWIKTHLTQLSTDLQKTRTFEELAETALLGIAPLTGMAYAALHVLDEQRGRLWQAGTYGKMGTEEETRPLAIGQGLVGQCAKSGLPLLLADPSGIPVRVKSGCCMLAPRELLVLPIQRAGKVLGVISLATLGHFAPEQRSLLDDLIPVLALNLEILAGNLETRRLLEQSQSHALELQESAERFEVISNAIAHSPASVMITDREGRIEYVNPKFERQTGFASEEVRGRNPRLLKSGLTPGKVYQDLWDTILSGREWQSELCNKKKNGELYWEMVLISPVLGREGQITHFVSVHEDITERRHLDEELKERMDELARFARLTVDREERMIALKQEINTLRNERGESEKYVIPE